MLSMFEASRLVHINPDTAIVSLAVEVIETFSPKLLALFIEPINKDSLLWPDL
jgi:hypothetical protein